MLQKRLNLTLETVHAIAAVSHLLTWAEFQTYTLILTCADQNTMLARISQSEISEISRYSVATIRRHLDAFRSLGLIRRWRGPGGLNYYRVILPLTDEAMQSIRERLPKFGVETKRRSRKKETVEDAITMLQPQQETLAAQGSTENITMESVAAPVPGIESSGPKLDPEISSLLDAIEKGTVRNSVCRFLEYLGVVEPQLAMDQEIVVDRESLLTYLIEHDANSIDKFGELHQTFTESDQQLPYIDVPESFPISLHLHHKLDLHLCGLQWLRKMVKMRNGDGIPLLDREIRENLFDFMKENGIKTFDEVVKRCKSKHDEIVSAKRNQSYVAPEEFGLGQYIQ